VCCIDLLIICKKSYVDDYKSRSVQYNEAGTFCYACSCRYFETSATSGYKVSDSFDSLIAEIASYKKVMEKFQQQSQSQSQSILSSGAATTVLQTISSATGIFSSVSNSSELQESLSGLSKSKSQSSGSAK